MACDQQQGLPCEVEEIVIDPVIKELIEWLNDTQEDDEE